MSPDPGEQYGRRRRAVKIVQVRVICKSCREVLAWVEDRGALVPTDPTLVEIFDTDLVWQFRDPDLIEFQREHDASRKIGPGIPPKHATLIGSTAGQNHCDFARAPRLLPLWCSRHGDMEPIYASTLAAALEHQESYLIGLLAFLGVTDVTVVRAEGIALGAEAREAAIARALDDIAAITA